MVKKALIVVDVQNDFLPGGALAVPRGYEIIPFVNRLVQLPFDVIVATCDFHPPGHYSFASAWGKKVNEIVHIDGVDQILWPDHCVQNTWGAEFSRDLDTSYFHKVFYKGVDLQIDSYSAFFDNERKKSTGLERYLKEQNCQQLYFVGLATDYCVLYSVRDALGLGFQVYVVSDACQGIELVEGDVARAFAEMRSREAILTTTAEVEASFAERLSGS